MQSAPRSPSHLTSFCMKCVWNTELLNPSHEVWHTLFISFVTTPSKAERGQQLCRVRAPWQRVFQGIDTPLSFLSLSLSLCLRPTLSQPPSPCPLSGWGCPPLSDQGPAVAPPRLLLSQSWLEINSGSVSILQKYFVLDQVIAEHCYKSGKHNQTCAAFHQTFPKSGLQMKTCQVYFLWGICEIYF